MRKKEYMKKITLIVLSICLMHTAHAMNDNPDDIEMASMATASPAGALREPLVLAHADLESQHAAASATTQIQEPLLAQPQNPHPLPVNVHATAYMNSTALERKFDDLTQVIKKQPRAVGLDGSLACAGSVCVGIVLYCMLGKIQPSCNCSCPAPAPVMCSFPTPRPTPLTMDNGTISNSTHANMTTNNTMPASTSGFMDTFSTLFNASSDNDTMPTTVPTKLKRD